MTYKTTSAAAGLIGSTVASYQPISSVAGQASDGVSTVVTALLDRLSKYEDVSLIDSGCAGILTSTNDLIVAVNGTPNATVSGTVEATDAAPSDGSITAGKVNEDAIPAGSVTADTTLDSSGNLVQPSAEKPASVPAAG